MIRRHFIASIAAALAVGAYGAGALAQSVAQAVGTPPTQRPPGAKATVPVILVLGDSLSAEYGLRRGTGWVALLEK